ncbi:MAG: dihydroorotate dehydrogenase electron transfer subunit [Candidatus Omnitrophota bacterium]
MQKLKVKILENKKVGPDFFLLDLESEYITAIALPGQIIHIRIESKDGVPFLRRPFSIHGIVNENTFRVLYEVVGKGTEILSNRAKGGELDIIGPLGNGFRIEPRKINLLVAGGMGFAPLLFLAQTLKKSDSKKEIIAFAGARSKDRLIADRELAELSIETKICTDDGTYGGKGFVTELVEEFLKKQASWREEILISACGPNAMLKALIEVAAKFNVESQISVEEVFACGVGACLGCAVKTKDGYKMACKEGPVFDGNEVLL